MNKTTEILNIPYEQADVLRLALDHYFRVLMKNPTLDNRDYADHINTLQTKWALPVSK